MNTDLSVAPEIARLADPIAASPLPAALPRTDGRIAGALSELAATPQRWWDLVRFDPAGPVRLPVPGEPGAWLLVLPPGAAVDCDCRQATALAGEATEEPGAPLGHGGAQPNRAQPNRAQPNRPQPSLLRTGRVRVHGTGTAHRLRAVGPGYSVTLHTGDHRPRSA